MPVARPRRPVGLVVVALAAGYAACGTEDSPAAPQTPTPSILGATVESPLVPAEVPLPPSAPLARAMWPQDKLIVRDCGSRMEEEAGIGGGVVVPAPRGYGAGPAATGAMGASGTGGMGSLGTKGDASGITAFGAPKPVAPAKAVPAAPTASQEASAAAAAPPAMPDPADRAVAAADKAAEKKPMEGLEDRSADEGRGELSAPIGPKVDWGAKVYLSNDDSMSLASAQHLLHAVDHGQPYSVTEVRPHELLNYFSFDYAAPPDGKTALFSVLPSAEKTAAETLTVAFAVRGAMPARKPLDLTVVVDRSGSMSAEGRMTYVKRALDLASKRLVDGDRLDLVWFDHEVCTPVENFVVGRDDPRVVASALADLAPRGATNIGIGLQEGYRIAADKSRDVGITRNRRVMLLTDALANQGTIDAAALGKVGEGFDKMGIRLTGVGVGVGFNDKILDQVTERGKGPYVYLGSEAVVDRMFGADGFRSLTETVATDVQFSIDLPESVAMERFYGEEASTDKADVQTITYSAGTTQLFLQDLRVDPNKARPTDRIDFEVTYRDAATGEPGKQAFSWSLGSLLSADRHNLRKGRALMAWTDLLTAHSLGADECGAPTTTWAERAASLRDDAEIAYVNKLVGKWCRVPDAPVAVLPPTTAPFKVRVDSDVPIAEVSLACGARSWTQAIGGADTVARFEAAPAGACTVTLAGMVPLSAAVDVPSVGGDVKCTVRGGRVICG